MVRGHILTMAVAKAMAMLLNLRTSREPVELGMGLGEVQLRAMEALLRLVSMDRRREWRRGRRSTTSSRPLGASRALNSCTGLRSS